MTISLIGRLLGALQFKPELPPPKVFKPKFLLPELDSYSGDFPSWFRGLAPANYNFPGNSLVDSVKLREAAIEYGFQDLETLDKVCANF